MELCKEYKSFSSPIEQDEICESFELDFQENLPQYLDDIEKIVKCSVNCVVTDYECTGGTIKLYGKSLISVTYLSSQNSLLSNIFEEEFAKQINTSYNGNIDYANIRLTAKYSSFRLINQRRIDVHTSLKACITAFSSCNDNCLMNCKNAFVKEYNPSVLCEKMAGICSEEFDEIFAISDANSQIVNIVNTFTSCIIEDKKIIKDKMLIKLKVNVSVVYENDKSSLDKCVHSFSLSKIIDVNNACENDCCNATATVSGIYVKTRANDLNKLCDIEVVGRVTINYSVMSVCEESFIVDSYMSGYNTDLDTKKISLKATPVYHYDDKSFELQYELDKSIVEIIDFKASIVNSYVCNSELIVTVKASALYIDDKSELSYYEATKDYKLILSDEKLCGIGQANILSYDYVIKNAESISIRINIEYSVFLYDKKEINVVTDICATAEKDNSNQPQLTLYFAKENENIWDIAKKFSTSVSLIMDENDLTSQIIEGQRVILVPGM